MKFAIIGATHGNEPLGTALISSWSVSPPKKFKHDFECFIGNPKAYELNKRYVDSDLNRAYDNEVNPLGNEQTRSSELKNLIHGKFDFSIDIHTTTSNMGYTVIMPKTDSITRNAGFYLKQKFDEIKLIEASKVDDEAPFVNRITPSGIMIEVGPVPNGIVRFDQLEKVNQYVSALLDLDFDRDIEMTSSLEVYKEVKPLSFPDERKSFFIHPNLQDQDFKPLQKGSPLFKNLQGKEILFEEDQTYYPIFINEAAYQELNMAALLCEKISLTNT